MGKYKLLALAIVFVALERVPAQVVTFSSTTKLIIVNVSVKDKSGMAVANLKKEDFEVTEDGKKQGVDVFEFEKLANDLLPAVADASAPKQLEERVKAAPKPAATPAPAPKDAASMTGSLESSQRKDRRLLAMFFDMTTMPQFDQIRAIDQATKFIREQMTSSDLVQIMNYGTKLNVLQEFTDDRELLLTTLKNMVVGEGSELAGAAATRPGPKAMIPADSRRTTPSSTSSTPIANWPPSPTPSKCWGRSRRRRP